MLSNIGRLILFDLITELRQKQSAAIVLLYAVTTLFVIYFAFGGRMEAETWNAMYWILILFVSTTAASGSFRNVSDGRFIYISTLASPAEVIAAKLCWNLLVMLVISSICLLLFIVVFGIFAPKPIEYLGAWFLGVSGISLSMTMIAGIASRAGNSFYLVPILGFPVLIPVLLTILRVTGTLIQGGSTAGWVYYAVLVLLNIIAAGIPLVLFPYLWRD